MENNIVREYPTIKDNKLYKDRYQKEHFEKYKQIKESIENYEKWKVGINFNTNRKIKIGGKIHKKLGYEHFYIKFGNSCIKFTNLDDINIEVYIQETEKLKEEIDNYNLYVYNIINQINLLEKWEDYILFEGIKYGIPYVYKNIHRGNNCFGIMIEDYVESCNCHLCEDWGGCSNSSGTQYYKCKKCDFKYFESISYFKNYKGK